MYVIKKDGIKRYVGEIKKEIPCGYFSDYQMELHKIEYDKYSQYDKYSLTVYIKVPEEITMLGVWVGFNYNDDTPPDFYLKVVPNQLIKISYIGKGRRDDGRDDYHLTDAIVNNNSIFDKLSSYGYYLAPTYTMQIEIEFSEKINNHEEKPIIDTDEKIPIVDVRNYPDISEEEYNKNVAFHLKRGDYCNNNTN